MIHPPSANESLKKSKRKALFTILGVPWTVTERSLLFVPTRLGFGAILAMLFLRDYGRGERVRYGAIFGALTLVTNGIHILGHTLGGRRVGSPMNENLITETSIFTVYHGDQGEVPRRVHLSRALGGPLANILAGLATLPLWPVFPGPAVRFFTLLNFLFGFAVSLPVPDADGEVIWRELLRS
ncbi:MAG: hypothetical protein R3335_01945 [Anaerolineales bacterium]|nr:hypothetical protein [Anaerolineales bacterium]